MRKFHNPHHPATGFTLVEILVATAVFIIVLVLLLDIFLIFVRGQATELSKKQLENELTYLFERASTELRQTPTDYSVFTGVNPADSYYFIDSTGFQQFIGPGSNPAIGGSSTTIYLSNYTTATPLTGQYSVVDSIQFYAYPATDPTNPLVPGYSNNQPTVVMYVKAHHVDHPDIVLEYQTMITSRRYVR